MGDEQRHVVVDGTETLDLGLMQGRHGRLSCYGLRRLRVLCCRRKVIVLMCQQRPYPAIVFACYSKYLSHAQKL